MLEGGGYLVSGEVEHQLGMGVSSKHTECEGRWWISEIFSLVIRRLVRQGHFLKLKKRHVSKCKFHVH